MNKQTTEQEHDDLVSNLVKNPIEVCQELTPEKADLWHAATGVTTESGELLDAVKRLTIYNKDLDDPIKKGKTQTVRQNIVEELGDLEFYMKQLRQRLGISREETLEGNIKKLTTRYQGSYSNEKADKRQDKEVND